MATVAEQTAVSVSFEAYCGDECNDFATPLHEQLASGRYNVCSVLQIPDSIEEWKEQHRTARKRAARAERLGYRVNAIARHEWADDLYEINTSMPERQGRPMSEGYHRRPSETPDPVYPCPRHGVHPYGVIDARGKLTAYLWCYRAGELALVSQILGHAEHLPNDVMYLLFQGALEREIPLGGTFVYNLHSSGTDGLRYFKERLGFEPRFVSWELA